MALYEEIRKRLDGLFNDDSFANDQFLQSLVRSDGWIKLQKIYNFKRFTDLHGYYGIPSLVAALQEENIEFAEIDAAGTLIRKKTCDARIRDYVHFLFSPENWSKDLYLQTLAESHAGLIPISGESGILKFKKMSKMLNFESPRSSEAAREAKVCSALESSALVECIAVDSFIGVRAISLRRKVRKQIDFYFGDANYGKDTHLQEIASLDDQLYVPIADILKWPKMRTLVLPQVSAIALLLRSSDVVEVSSDGLKIRKRGCTIEAIDEFESDVSNTIAESSATPVNKGSIFTTRSEYTAQVKTGGGGGAGRGDGKCGSGGGDVGGNAVATGGSGTGAGRGDGKCGGGGGAVGGNVVATGGSGMGLAEGKNDISADGTETKDSADFSVVQYNILADCLCHCDYADPAVLRWKAHRWPLLRNQIFGSGADIIALQEIQDAKHHVDLIRGTADNEGYDSVFFHRVGMDGELITSRTCIGNLLLFRRTSFVLLDQHQIAFAPLIKAMCNSQEQEEHFAKFFPHGSATARVRHIRTGKTVLVSSTHIACNFKNPDMQLAQAVVLCRSIEQLASPDDAVLILGDFNVTPHTGVHKYMVDRVPPGHPVLSSTEAAVEPLFNPDAGLSHNLSLLSAYATVNGTEPTHTNVDGGNTAWNKPPFVGCLDYIFYSTRTLRPVVVAPIAPIEELTQEGGGLPNSLNPSDHVPIGATFDFT